MVTKLKKKLKLGQNSKTQIVTKLKNSNCDKTQIVTKLKLWQNSNCDTTLFVREREKIKNMTKPQLWQNSRTPIKTKIKKSNYDKTEKLKLWQNLKYDKSKNIWIKKTLNNL